MQRRCDRLCNWVEAAVKTHPKQTGYLKELKFRANYIICYSADPQCRADQTRGSGLNLDITPSVWQASYSYVWSSQGGSCKRMPMQGSLTPMPGKGWNFLSLKSRQRQGKFRANAKCCGRLPPLRRIPSLYLQMRRLYYLSWRYLHLMQRCITPAD